MSETQPPQPSQEVVSYTSKLYCSLLLPLRLKEGDILIKPMICIAIRVPLVSQDVSHLFVNAFHKKIGGWGHWHATAEGLKVPVD